MCVNSLPSQMDKGPSDKIADSESMIIWSLVIFYTVCFRTFFFTLYNDHMHPLPGSNGEEKNKMYKNNICTVCKVANY